MIGPPSARPRSGPSELDGRSVEVAQNLRKRAEHLVDVALLQDQGRRQGDDVARGADQQALLEAAEERLEGPLRGLAGHRLQLDAGDDPEIAQIDDVTRTLQGMDRV